MAICYIKRTERGEIILVNHGRGIIDLIAQLDLRKADASGIEMVQIDKSNPSNSLAVMNRNERQENPSEQN